MTIIVSSSELQEEGRRATQTTLLTDREIPIAYGLNPGVEALIGPVVTDGVDIAVMAVWSVGRISGISEVKFDGADPHADVEQTDYLGELSQQPDPTLVAMINGYADRLIYRDHNSAIAYAYSVFKWPVATYEVWPVITATIDGLIGTTSPVLAAADLIENPIYGLGELTNPISVLEGRRANEQLVGSTQRRVYGQMVDQSRTINGWIDAMQENTGCWHVKVANEWHFLPDRPARPVATISRDQYIAGSYRVNHAGFGLPNRIDVLYTHTDDEGISTVQRATALTRSAELGNEPIRRAIVKLLGIRNYAEATRAAIERLNSLQQLREHRLTGFASLLEYLHGDHLELETPNGDIVDVRLVQPGGFNQNGTVQCTFVDYSEEIYSDANPSTPVYDHGDVLIS